MDYSIVSEIILSLLALTVLEIVLGIDNLVFISIVSNRLPKAKQKPARRIGLSLAWITRLLLLATAVWLTKLTKPWITLFNFALSGRDIFLMLGGLFLLFKATQEIHIEISTHDASDSNSPKKRVSFGWVITQIAILDVIFSLDSVITAIGLTDYYIIMVIAITIAILTMIFASEFLSAFIHRHPTIKMLALSFLMLIGMVLIADGFHVHIPRGYIYFSMFFSLAVEALNMLKKNRTRQHKTK